MAEDVKIVPVQEVLRFGQIIADESGRIVDIVNGPRFMVVPA